MKEHTHDDFLALIRERISKKQYDDLFSGGCCFHFALRSFKRGIGSLAYVRAARDPNKKGHVFVITTDGRAFDRRGYREIGALKKELCEWGDESHFLATEAEIEGDVVRCGLPTSLENQVFAIADEIITEKA